MKKRGNKRCQISAIVVIILVFAVIIVASLVYHYRNNEIKGGVESGNVNENALLGTQIISYSLGEQFTVSSSGANFSMTINNLNITNTTSLESIEIATAGFYLYVNGELTNTGSETYDLMYLTGLKDNENKFYSELAYNFGEGALAPGIKKNFYYLYDIPQNVSGLKLIVKDDKNTKFINLGI